MKYELNKLFAQQKKLDSHIHQNHNISYSGVIDELKLALTVELAELSNEIRCFKFWSNKKPSAREVILEEYVDGLHFITSLSLYYETEQSVTIGDIKIVDDKKQLTKILNTLFHDINNLNKENVNKWMQQYFIFGMQLGFSFADIMNAYDQKNQINHQRQDNNY